LYEGQYEHEHEHKDGEGLDVDAPLTLRALVSTKEAGVIIGKAGKNVADLRDQTGVKAGVSKVVQGVHDRVLTVTGTIEGVAKVIIISRIRNSLVLVQLGSSGGMMTITRHHKNLDGIASPWSGIERDYKSS
jgi:hypothetical protein